MRIAIRPMVAKDKSAIMDILRAIREFTAQEVAVAEEVIDAYLEAPSASEYLVVVAEVGGVVTGYIGPTPLASGTWDIYWVAVNPGGQGRGVGRALMSFTENRIKEGHGRLVIVETSGRPDYDKTRRFYRSLGYRVAARIADFYSPGDDKLILEKRLT
ncbi:MAG: GNAT family N-acetyltransferase [Dehalococcoidia bacterium]|nr:GNAT family N-acetyltransferase [Dehalococcoidia bacterium]